MKEKAGNPMQVIPYRESKITHLLYDYFSEGGNNIVMIVNARVNKSDISENIKVLHFANLGMQVKQLKQPPNINIKPVNIF